MENKYTALLHWFNVIIDYLLLNGIFYLSFIMSNHELDWRLIYNYKLTILIINFCWFYSYTIFDLYKNILIKSAVAVINANIATLCVFIALALTIKLFYPYLYVPPTPFIYYFALFPALVLFWKSAFLILRKYRFKYWFKSNQIVIVGAGQVGVDLYNYISSNPHLEYNVVGVFDNEFSRVPPHIKYLGSVKECISYSGLNKITEIFCTLPYTEFKSIEWLMLEADKNLLRFRLVPDIKGPIHRNFMVEMFGFVPVLKPRQEPLENKANEVVKRIFDVVFSCLVIILILSWLIPVLAVVIKLDSKGPVFFKQLRSGKNNKPFYCLKLRSMVVNTCCDNVQACKGDARVTRVGRFIRKTSLDELPQFFNVLMGDMSVVGPRPHMLKHTQDYSQLIDNYMVRHFLTPGITGWAQVNGYRGEITESKALLNRVKADLWYLENWSILLDLKIVLLTIWKVLQSDEEVY